MALKIKKKEATAIINSLGSGVVPRIGVQHITVGRHAEIRAFTESLEDVKNGHSAVKFWIGEFGSGKSFMLHLLNTVALKQKFVVANADFTPEKRLYANDRKAVALYSTIINNIAIQTKPEGNALSTLLDKWIEQIISNVAVTNKIPITNIKEEKYWNLIEEKLINTTKKITETGSFDFALVIQKYFDGYISANDELKRCALKWLKGEYTTKTEARKDLEVRDIVNDTNYYDMLKNFCSLFIHIGYNGFMINLDEAINLYKITTSKMREKNYEKLLSIFNDCFQGRVENMFINVAGTEEFLKNQRRGLYSYNALKTRLETNKYETKEYRDLAQPVIDLKPLTHDEIYVLLKKLKEIFNFNYNIESNINEEDILHFMEDLFNKPGAHEFLTPREVIRDFINILNILRQNPDADKNKLIAEIIIEDERPKEDMLDSIDSIEEL